MERGEMTRIRTAVWSNAEDFRQIMAPPPEDDDADLAEALAEWGLREEG